MGNKGLKEITELFNALDLIAKTAGKVYKDKKVDMADLPLLIDVAVNVKVLMDAFAGLDEAVAEVKDLEAAEQLVIVQRLFQVAKNYEENRKAQQLGASAILAIVRAAFEAVPLILKELENLRNSIEAVQNARTDMQLALIKERLNVLTNKLQTTHDKNELADIIRELNGL